MLVDLILCGAEVETSNKKVWGDLGHTGEGGSPVHRRSGGCALASKFGVTCHYETSLAAQYMFSPGRYCGGLALGEGYGDGKGSGDPDPATFEKVTATWTLLSK